MLILAVVVSVARALTAPVGWTQLGPARAALDAQAPVKGELREYLVAGGQGDPDEILMLLGAGGPRPTGWGKDAKGQVDLVFDGMVGKARCRVKEGTAVWVVVLAGTTEATSLDPDALLLAALPPEGVAWGAGAVQVLPAGPDANPWGAQASSAPQGWWGDDVVEGWGVDAGIVGTWEGTLLLTGQPTRIRLRLENTGRVVLERKSQGKTEVFEGAWATRRDRIRLEIPGGGENLDYQLLGSTLTVEYAGAPLTLHRQAQ